MEFMAWLALLGRLRTEERKDINVQASLMTSAHSVPTQVKVLIICYVVLRLMGWQVRTNVASQCREPNCRVLDTLRGMYEFWTDQVMCTKLRRKFWLHLYLPLHRPCGW